MAAFNYANSAANAARLLNRFGAACTLKRRSAGDYDADTGIAGLTETAASTIGVVFDYDAKYIDGTLILQGDRRAFLEATYAPVQGDSLTWNGADFVIVASKAVAPAGTAVLYECQIRGAGVGEASPLPVTLDGEMVIDGGGDA